jgi:hypothetical protein
MREADMKLFQYWDQPTPPPLVLGWIEGYRLGNPELDHMLFDEASAGDFIARHCGEREAAAFRACAVPAMQSDFFRLCALRAFGGIYMDADQQSLQPLSTLIERAPKSMLFTNMGVIANGFVLFREPGNTFVRECLRLAVDNIENRRFNICFTATGPAIYNAVRGVVDPQFLEGIRWTFELPVTKDWGFDELVGHARALIAPTSDLKVAVEEMTIIDIGETYPWIGALAPDYKQTDRHWLHWKESLYR